MACRYPALLRPGGAGISLVNLTHGVPSAGGQGRGLSYSAPDGAASLPPVFYTRQTYSPSRHPDHLICVHLRFHPRIKPWRRTPLSDTQSGPDATERNCAALSRHLSSDITHRQLLATGYCTLATESGHSVISPGNRHAAAGAECAAGHFEHSGRLPALVFAAVDLR